MNPASDLLTANVGNDILGSRGVPEPGAGQRRADARLAAKVATHPPLSPTPDSRQVRRFRDRKLAKKAR